MPHARAFGASEDLFIHPSLINPSVYPSIFQLPAHPFTHVATYPPTDPSTTYSPTVFTFPIQ